MKACRNKDRRLLWLGSTSVDQPTLDGNSSKVMGRNMHSFVPVLVPKQYCAVHSTDIVLGTSGRQRGFQDCG